MVAAKVKTPYSNQVESELMNLETQDLLDVIEKIGLDSFLLSYPLSKISLVEKTMIGDREINGDYDFDTESIRVNLNRTNNDFGSLYHKQRFWSISTLARTAQESVEKTLVHELAHHLHKKLRDLQIIAFRATKLMPTSNGLSQYSLINSYEYFAECFAAYVFHRLELLLEDSLGYDMIERALKALGLTIKEWS